MAKREREKAAKIAEIKEKRPHAHARHVRISPSKVRIVIDQVRGKSVNDAIACLEAMPKSASAPVLKLIKSASANAEHNMDMPRIDLYVAAIFADAGPTLKRVMPRAKGRAYHIAKRTSHITVILDSVKEAK